MGRITIFTLEECSHCIRAKQAFKARNIPYMEISLSKHPSKRNDMLSLSNRLTVPQIFLNNQHIGGANDTLQLLKKWDNNKEGVSPYQIYQTTVAHFDDTLLDPSLQPSTEPPIVEPPSPLPRNPYTIEIPTSSQNENPNEPKRMMSVYEIMELLKRYLPRRDLSYKFTIYKNAFLANDIIDIIKQEFKLTRNDAINFVKILQTKHFIFHHVTNDHILNEDSSNNYDNLYFRLQCDHTPYILNSYRIWTKDETNTDTNVMALLKRLKSQLNQILKDHTNTMGQIDYKQAKNHIEFTKLEEAICELQIVDLYTMSDNTKLAFCINLYNLMIKYAFAKIGIATSTRNAFFNTVSIRLANNTILSLQEIENGILRGNRRAPYTFQKPFTNKTDDDDDRRIELAMTTVYNRIHFALNCGASSCPPVQNFTSEGIYEELRIVARAFCEDDDNVRIGGNDGTALLYLSKIFYWYIEDFGGNNTNITKSVLHFLENSSKADALKRLFAKTKSRGGYNNIKIKYNTYDWSTDASDFVSFTSDSVKADIGRFSL